MSGAQTSSFPDQNILFSSLSGATGLALRRNELLNTQTEQQIGDADTESVARASQWMLAESGGDEAKMAALYPGVVADLQRQGRARNAPPQFPGAAAIRRLGAMGISAEKQYEQQGVAGDYQTWLAGRGRGTATSGAAAPGAAPAVPIPARGTGGPGATAAVPTEWLPHFYEASRETGIPVDLLIAQARQESSFNPKARGAAGEVGLFQIKPSTAQSPGFGVTGVDPATLDDPRQNILFGARYLRGRMGQGDPNNPADQARALAAYNGGGDPNYVANVNRYRPGQSPTDPGRAVATYTPGAPGTGGGVVARNPGAVNVAGPGGPTASPVPAPVSIEPETGVPVVASPAAPPGAVAPVAAPAQPVTAPPAQQPPAATVAPPPPRLQNGLTAEQDRTIQQLEAIRPRNRAEFDQQQKLIATTEQTYRQHNETVDRQYRIDVQTQTDKQQAATLAGQKAERERINDAKLEQSKSEDADSLRVLQAIGPKIRAGQELTPQETDQYDLHRRKYAEGPMQQVPLPGGGMVLARAGREISDRFPPLPGQKEYAGLKPVPGTERPAEMASPQVVGGMLANATGMEKILKAQRELDEYGGAVGMKGNLPEFILQRADPEGVSARAAISNVGGHEFHDMSGATISQGEGRRLTYIPGTQDTEQAVRVKLQKLLEDNREILLKSYRTYGPENKGRSLPEVEAAIIESIPEVARVALKKDESPQAAKNFDRVFGRGAAKLVLNHDG